MDEEMFSTLDYTMILMMIAVLLLLYNLHRKMGKVEKQEGD